MTRPGRWRGAWPGRGIGLGRVLGVPVRLDPTWFAGLAVLVALSRELWAPALTGTAAVLLSGVFALAFFGCVMLHELAHALVAMAGPLASVLLAGLLNLTSRALAGPAGDLLALLFVGNLVVAGFNLLPGFPLDGGRVARALVWRVTGRRLLATRVTALLGRVLAAALVLGGTAAALWQQTPRWLPQIILGLFLWQAATEGERSAARSDLLAGRGEHG